MPSATDSLFVSVRPSNVRVADATAIQGDIVRVEGYSVASIVRKQYFAVKSNEISFPSAAEFQASSTQSNGNLR